MTKTNHIQVGLAYCHLKKEIVAVPGEHVEKVCLGEKCQYLNGSAQGEGIECLYDDGTDRPFTNGEDPYKLQKLDQPKKKASRSKPMGK